MTTNPWIVLAIISGALLIIGIDMTVLNVTLPSLTQELGATTSDKLWMINAYSLVMAGLLPGFGSLADRVGHKKILLWGMGIFGIASLAAAYAPNSAWLIAARGALAVGGAMMLPATLSITRLVFKKDQQRATAIGIWGSVWAGSAALGPILGGLLLSQFWWGSVFLINVPIVLVTMALTVAFVPNIPGNPERRFDVITSAFLTIGLVGLLYGLKSALKADIYWSEVGIAAAVGTLFIWLFLHRQRGDSGVIIDFALFRSPRFSIGAGVALVAGFALIGVQYVVSQELQLVRSMTPLAAGLFVLPLAIASFVSGPVVGSVMLKFGMERTMAAMLGLAALGLGLYLYGGHGGPVVWEFTTFALIGFGSGGAMAVASTSIMLGAPDEKAGMAGSIESIAYELGGTLGVAVMGSVLAAVFSRSLVAPAGVNLPVEAWDGLDQTLMAAEGQSADIASAVIDAGKNAFLGGANATFVLSTVVATVLFVVVAAYALNKKPVHFAVKH